MVSYFLSNSADNFQQELEGIISRILNISAQSFDVEKFKILNDSVRIIINNIEPLIKYLEKMQKFIRFLTIF